MLRFALSVVLLTVNLTAPALAWGDRGHRTTAKIAWRQMTPQARNGVNDLIASADVLATPACRVSDFSDASVWADCVRSRYKERFYATSKWHYIDIPVCDRAFRLPADPDNRFVITRLEREASVLADRSQPRARRLEALMWVAHLIGDIHQPLHVGDRSDRGGNEVQIRSPRDHRDVKLHAFWDSELVDDALGSEGGIEGMMADAAAARRSPAVVAVPPEGWARESWNLSRTVAYGLLGGDIACPGGAGEATVSDQYVAQSGAIVRQRLELAGVRLALLLNQSFR